MPAAAYDKFDNFDLDYDLLSVPSAAYDDNEGTIKDIDELAKSVPSLSDQMINFLKGNYTTTTLSQQNTTSSLEGNNNILPHSQDNSMNINATFLQENTTFAPTDISPFFQSTNTTTDYSVFRTDPLYNESLIMTDNPIRHHEADLNTPLTAPESDLVTSATDRFLNNLLGKSSNPSDELTWLIPIVIATVVIFIILALLLYYGVRLLELRTISCCRRNCACCRCLEYGDGETVALTSENLVPQTELREYRSYSQRATLN